MYMYMYIYIYIFIYIYIYNAFTKIGLFPKCDLPIERAHYLLPIYDLLTPIGACMYICIYTYSNTWASKICLASRSESRTCSFTCVTWLADCYAQYMMFLVCVMTHSHVWHDTFTCPATARMCGMTHTYMWHDFFTDVTLLVYMCDMTDSRAWRHSSFHSHAQNLLVCVTWIIRIRDMTHWHM